MRNAGIFRKGPPSHRWLPALCISAAALLAGCSPLPHATAVHAERVAKSDYAAWAKKKPDGSWTAAAEAAVRASNLPKAVPADIARFCPGYASQPEGARVQFWVGLLSAIAKPESNFKPETKYRESFVGADGQLVISRGLLQLSIESVNQKKYSCNIQEAEDLHDPAINLQCGVRILNAWVKDDNVIATYGSDAPRGGGRYWSTLRESKKHIQEMMAFTRKLEICGG